MATRKRKRVAPRKRKAVTRRKRNAVSTGKLIPAKVRVSKDGTVRVFVNPRHLKNPADTIVYISRIKLDRQGYEKSGQYWGVGAPLFQYETSDYSVHGEMRASSLTELKQRLKKKYPQLKIFRKG